ncbi:MAG: hypothetical protein JYX80_05160 [Candidatus Scalindua sediminis]|nr:hypothetical protein [Candidatus Scalindua sediminis]
MEGYEVVLRSQIDGDFEGFDDEVLFKLMDGSYWIQDEYKYWYRYAYCPEALILRKNGRFYIQVDRQSEIVPVQQISGVIESKINGEFKGWEGETTYELLNGQVWQQSSYKYEYKYAYMPEVLIYNPGGGHIMQVAGTSASVRRVR